MLIERWRIEYNMIRPHSSLGYRPPAPKSFQPWSETVRQILAKTYLLKESGMLSLT